MEPGLGFLDNLFDPDLWIGIMGLPAPGRSLGSP